jgi:hypothetical protein
MKDYEIEDDVPLPEQQSEVFLKKFKEMKDGQSFLIDDEPITQNLRGHLQSAAYRARVVIRQKKEGLGLRVWREREKS